MRSVPPRGEILAENVNDTHALVLFVKPAFVLFVGSLGVWAEVLQTSEVYGDPRIDGLLRVGHREVLIDLRATAALEGIQRLIFCKKI
jgi:hypothetical protein